MAALSAGSELTGACLLSGVKRTWLGDDATSASDPEPTKAPLKSRSAVGLPQCYLPLRSTGETAGETARVHHAARRRGGGSLAARCAREARTASVLRGFLSWEQGTPSRGHALSLSEGAPSPRPSSRQARRQEEEVL